VANSKIELLRGTLDMMILKALTWGPRHGYAVARWIEEGTDDTLRIEEGSLYPALHRMARRGWIEAEWGRSENKRRAKFYKLTDEGRRQLKAETAAWNRFAHAVSLLMGTAALAEG
jgi:PadR family transcriptional regulator PadR